MDGRGPTHPHRRSAQGVDMGVDVGCPRMDLIIIYYIGTTLYIMVSHMPICAHARRTHARTHTHDRVMVHSMVIVRVRWTQKTKNTKARFLAVHAGRRRPLVHGQASRGPVSDHGDRGAQRRRQSSTLLSSSSSSFEPHAHAMSTSAMMQAVGETMHAYTHDDHAMRRVVVVVVVVARAGREDATERCRRAYPSTSARTMAARADPGAKAARTSRGRTA